MLYFAVILPFIALSFWAQRRVSSTFAQWAQVPSSTGKTGAEMARAILNRNGLNDVEVRHVPGSLSDHYDPRNRTVNLSDNVFSSSSVSAVAVAAHEVGHAIQHSKAYFPLTLRSLVLPAASFGSAAFMPLFLVGMVLSFAGSALGETVWIVAVALFAFAVLFQIITLPVEFNASTRARAQMNEMNISTGADQEAQGVAKVLNAAALTYVAAALAALAQLAYFVAQILLSRN